MCTPFSQGVTQTSRVLSDDGNSAAGVSTKDPASVSAFSASQLLVALLCVHFWKDPSRMPILALPPYVSLRKRTYSMP